MARKKKKGAEDYPVTSGAFVPASQNSSHSRRSNSFSFQDDASKGFAPASGSFEQYSRNTADYSNRKRKGMSRGGKIALTIVIIALIAGVAALGFYVYKEVQKASINKGLHDMSAEVMQAIDNELTGMTTFEEPFTVLLLGSDERNGEDEEDIGARTDTIVLCRIDPTQNIISMVSVPRDTRVPMGGGTYGKINAAYSYGGPSETIAAVKNLCGVEIDHYAEINFEGLVGLVDAIGGIDVHVDETVDDPDAGPVVVPEGDQHLDGVSALTFARSRDYADGDFTRVSNQRKVIEAIVHRGLEAPATELYGLIQASTTFLTTDSAMDADFIFSLADQIRHNNDYPVQVFSATLPASTDMIDGVSYVIVDQAGTDELMKVFLAGGDVSGGSAEAEAATATGATSATGSGAAATGSSSSSSSYARRGGGYDEPGTYG